MVKKKKFDKATFIKGGLRRCSLMFPNLSLCRRLARRAPNQYECSMCKGLFPSKEIDVDHIFPVIDILQGFVDWNTYVERLFCDLENLACLCKTCHKAKSSSETAMRKYSRAKRKAEANETLDKDYGESE